MAVATYTKTGAKASSAATLPKEVFAVEVKNHDLLNQAYNKYLTDTRTNNATTKQRGEVSGGGRKPWRQKGTGRARAGSIRSPLWTGGGVTFGPRGNENYTKKLSKTSKRNAVKQALTLQAKLVSIIESVDAKEGKTKSIAQLLNKVGAERRTLLVVDKKTDEVVRATNNLPQVKLVGATYLTVFDILNAHSIIIEKSALASIKDWLTGGAK